MLEHEPQHVPNQGLEVNAAHVRVSPEELAQAVARWQARREGTLTIGEAVQELGLEATPEELLREIQAARTPPTPARPRTRRSLVWAVGTVMAALLLRGFWLLIPQPTSSVPPVSPPAAPTTTAIRWSDTTLVEDAGRGQPILRTLGELKPGVPALASLSVTGDRAVLTDFSNAADAWTLVKHDSHLYLRGWIPAMSPAALRTNPVTLFSFKSGVPSGMTPEQVSIRLDTLSITPGLSDDDEIDTIGLTPDAHFHDSW